MKWIRDNWLLLFLAFVIVVAAIFSWGFIQFIQFHFGSFFPIEKTRADWGVLGDLFGGVLNPFFALLGLVMLLVTLFQNQKELSLSRQEFKDSAKSLRAQSVTLEKQRFEDTFFSLLDQHNIALNNITIERIDYDAEGKQSVADSIATILKIKYIGGGPYVSLLEDFYGLKESRKLLLKENIKLNQYFRILYQVLKFVASRCPGSSVHDEFTVSKLEETHCSQEEKLYSNIVRSLLPDEVYFLLAINCWCDEKDDTFYKYRLLVERYAFFEHMPLSIKNNSNNVLLKEIVNGYREKAFGDNSGYSSAKA